MLSISAQHHPSNPLLSLVSLPPSGSILILVPSIDLSLLPFLLFSPSVPSYLSLLTLSNPSVVPSLFSPLLLCPISHSLLSSLPPPSVSIFIATTLSLPLHLSSHPFHLTLSLGWLAGLFGSPTGHLSLCSLQLHSVAALFFVVVYFVNDGHQKEAGGTSSRRAEVSLRGTRLLCCVWNVSLWKFVLIVSLCVSWCLVCWVHWTVSSWWSAGTS